METVAAASRPGPVGPLRRLAGQTFAALANRNYRLFAGGHSISVIGNWMQTVAQAWLVLQLTGSPAALGVVTGLQTLPMLVFGPYGGVIADRVNKRTMLMILELQMGAIGAILGVLTLTDVVRPWHVYVLAFLLGLNTCFENPVRQAFLIEMVGPGNLRNAVSLNSTIINVGRTVGPAVAGVVIALGGLGICFVLNALSFWFVASQVWRMDVSTLHRSARAPRAKGQIREGFRYVARTPSLVVPLVMMATIGCLGYEFQVVLPVLARDSFDGDSRVYGFMTAAMGVGAVLGGLWTAARGRTGIRAMVGASTTLGVCLAVAAAVPVLWLEIVVLVFAGAGVVGLMTRGNSTLQLSSTPEMRGRVMALWAVAFLGTTPVGGPLAGFVCEHWGGRAGLALAGFGCLVASLIGLWALPWARRAEQAMVTPTSAGP